MLGCAVRRTSLLVLLLLASAQLSANEFAYLVVDAQVTQPERHRPPTWIAFRRLAEFRLEHVPTNSSVAKLPPGRYWLDHIDFGKSFRTSIGTFYYSTNTGPFELNAGTITYLGMLNVSVRNRGRVTYNVDQGLADAACAKLGAASRDMMTYVYINGVRHGLPKPLCRAT